MSVLFAGGGIQGGQVFGETDARAEYPKDKPIGPEDVAATVYQAMGITEPLASDNQDRRFKLAESARPLSELF